MNWPVVTPVFALLVGVTVAVEGNTGLVTVVTSAPATGANGVVAGAAPYRMPPLEGSSLAVLFPPCSAIQGSCVEGLTLMTLGSAPAVGTCHSLIVLSPRNTPTKLLVLDAPELLEVYQGCPRESTERKAPVVDGWDGIAQVVN